MCQWCDGALYVGNFDGQLLCSACMVGAIDELMERAREAGMDLSGEVGTVIVGGTTEDYVPWPVEKFDDIRSPLLCSDGGDEDEQDGGALRDGRAPPKPTRR